MSASALFDPTNKAGVVTATQLQNFLGNAQVVKQKADAEACSDRCTVAGVRRANSPHSAVGRWRNGGGAGQRIRLVEDIGRPDHILVLDRGSSSHSGHGRGGGNSVAIFLRPVLDWRDN